MLGNLWYNMDVRSHGSLYFSFRFLLPTIISTTTSTVTIFSQLRSASLLSVGKVYDDNTMVISDKDTVKAISCNSDLEALVNEQGIIIQGQQSRVDNSWHIDLNITIEKPLMQEYV